MKNKGFIYQEENFLKIFQKSIIKFISIKDGYEHLNSGMTVRQTM